MFERHCLLSPHPPKKKGKKEKKDNYKNKNKYKIYKISKEVPIILYAYAHVCVSV